jgi:hypothetical protein
VLFQAAANDEFEFLDGDSEWIHVGISGDSRGYLSRSSVDVPEKIAARLESPATASAEEKFTEFRMEREETSTFSGDWAELRGENRKDLHGSAGIAESQGIWTGGVIELFAGAFSEKEAAGTNPAPEGIVVISDSADGRIAGATMAETQRMVKGEVSREAFWTQSYLDPVEAFRGTGHP